MSRQFKPLRGMLIMALSVLSIRIQGAEPTKSSPPPPPPPASPSVEPTEIQTYRIKSLSHTSRSVQYDGALARLRKRARAVEQSKLSEEEKWRLGVENVSSDPITGQPQGLRLLVIKF